jgi:GntR family transcriptional regulator
MEFSDRLPIYLQIADALCEKILLGEWIPGDRIPSVRDMAVQLEVNPNTVQRTYGWIQEKGIIENQRGIGYFVSRNAFQKTLEMKKESFIHQTCPKIFKTLELLQLGFDDFQAIYTAWKSGQK